MAKLGMAGMQPKGLLVAAAEARGWVLCVGAGTSNPVFPDWQGLVAKLILRDDDLAATSELDSLRKAYPPDAFIQAALNRLEMDEEEFARNLASDLYFDAKALLPAAAWKTFLSALNARHVGEISLAKWSEFLAVISDHYPNLTAYSLADTVAEVLDTAIKPAAILSFNAEPLFASLINASAAVRWGDSRTTDVIDYVTHATSNRKRGRIPYEFCHGLLPVPEARRRPALSSVDKLVFSEGAYLQLANNAYSWQAESFIRAAAHHSVVFIGLSLTDSNIRRWLSWVHALRLKELSETGAPPVSTIHYWIAKEPARDVEKRWTEALVAHLGVRLVWVADYSDIGPMLRRMLSLA
ncbi:SIR2 family protein [Rhodanobacter sp. L36]|uniref:SIR2 family protein n=1 Tax=Rhodanobacter sp. L36 TaxID=1747221 RepID=UPI00131CC80B|nr:SIR2 family protein [Rhodanobacter sp. L36]